MTVRAETEVTLTRVDDGTQGADGTTFTPSVSASGDISWTNDGGKTNPPTQNIKGPQGDNGIEVYDGTAGSVVTVSNASAYPALELVADIIPSQPNNYSSVWVGGAGKNLLDTSGMSTAGQSGVTYSRASNGVITVGGHANSNAWKTIGSIQTVSGVQYTVNGCPSGGASGKYRITVAGYGYDYGSGYTFTGDGNAHNVTIDVYTGYPTSGTTLTFKPMVRLATETDATYAPYENICPIYGHDHCNVVVSSTLLDIDGTTYTTNFPQIVYKGSLDVVKGILTVTYKAVDMGAINYVWNNGYFYSTGVPDKAIGNYNLFSSAFETTNQPYASAMANGQIKGNASSSDIYIRWDAYSNNAAGLKTAVTGQQLVYELATPIVYSVSPKDIELLNGTNNVWATTGDITDFRYAEIAPATLETFGDARKIAVKYVTDMGDDGIIVHPEGDTSNYAKINAEGMDIVKNDESIAFYGEFSRVGRDNRSRTITSPKGVSMYTDDNVLAFSIGSSVNTGSVSVNEWVNYYATLNTSSVLTVLGLSQGAVGGDIQLGVTASYYDYNSVPNRQKTETNESIYFSVGTSATETWTVGASNDYTITITYDGSTSFTITNDIPITEQNYIRVAFVEYDKIDIIADVKLGSKTLSDGVWYTEARVVLWENESPKANFSAQTVSLGPVEQFNYCDELEITFINSVSGLRYGSARGPIDRVNYSDTHTILSQGAQTKLYSREVYFNYVGQVVFSNGNYDGTNGAQYCVPQKIIGIRHI